MHTNPRCTLAIRPARLLWPCALMLVAAICALGAKCVPPGSYTLATCTQTANPGNVQAQINGAGAGAVICMDAGTYRGPLVFQSKSGVTLRGQGAPATTIAGGGIDGLLVFNSSNLTFQNFALAGGHPTDAYITASQNIALQGVSADRGGIGAPNGRCVVKRMLTSASSSMTRRSWSSPSASSERL